MIFFNLFKCFFNAQRKIDVGLLPSQGLFYKDDFLLWIKKADVQDIIEYEHNYVKDNIGIILEKIKRLVEKNIIISSNYKFVDIKSIDIIFIFFEIVKFTKNKSVSLIYFNDETGKDEPIEFSSETFNYFKIEGELNQSYNKIDKSFDLNGYKYSLPSLGIENSLTNFLINKSIDPEAAKYKTLNYNFTYFLGHKNNV
jgi:hypothetical protein